MDVVSFSGLPELDTAIGGLRGGDGLVILLFRQWGWRQKSRGCTGRSAAREKTVTTDTLQITVRIGPPEVHHPLLSLSRCMGFRVTARAHWKSRVIGAGT